jgi:hypothetical protein
MNVSLEDFGTGWFGLSIGLKRREVDMLIESLRHLKEHPDGHFHAHNGFEGEGGVGDLEMCIIPEDFQENMRFDEDQGSSNKPLPYRLKPRGRGSKRLVNGGVGSHEDEATCP